MYNSVSDPLHLLVHQIDVSSDVPYSTEAPMDNIYIIKVPKMNQVHFGHSDELILHMSYAV